MIEDHLTAEISENLKAVSPGCLNLELDKIALLIADRCHSDPARNLCKTIQPSTDKTFIESRLKLINQLQEMLSQKFSRNFSGLTDIKELLSSPKHSCFSFTEFKDIYHLLNISNLLKEKESEWSNFSEFMTLSLPIAQFPYLERRFNEIFTYEGDILDTASPALRSIRERQRHVRQSIISTLTEKMNEQLFGTFLQEKIITERDGRFVIPIKDSWSKNVNGISHGKSASKSTVFMEPQEVVALNNESDFLKEDEKEEIYNILKKYTEDIRENSNSLLVNLEQLIKMDFFFAIASFSNDIYAFAPKISDKPIIKLYHARHPLLIIHFGNRNKVIPFSLELGTEYRILLISGPNTGGKTATLKAIGLLTTMALSGLPIPSDQESEIGIFTHFFADIGDNQSLESSLSTFSSHIGSIKNMLLSGNDHSLILADEIGSATDPEQGSALAQAILERFVEMKAICVMTTHYTALKVFAEHNPDCINAAMHFDPNKHIPTYEFKTGLPGNSFALEVASQLGLDDNLLTRAKTLAGNQNVELTELIAKISEQKKELARQNYEFSLKKRLMEAKINEYENALENQKKEQKDLRKKTINESRELLVNLQKELNKEIEELRKEDKENKKKKIKDIENKLVNLSADFSKDEANIRSDVRRRITNPAIGQNVWVENMQESGVITEISKDSIKVDMHGFMYVTSLENIYETQIIPADTEVKSSTKVKPTHVSVELKLLGLTFDEALPLIEEFLDEANYHGLNMVRIVHGKGTGALRMKVRDYLRKNPKIKSFHSPAAEAGGDGVTVACFKENK